MKRTNSVADALNAGAATVDLGDGFGVDIPLNGTLVSVDENYKFPTPLEDRLAKQETIIGMLPKLVDRGNMPAAVDLNTYKGVESQGVWSVGTGAVTGGANWPPGYTQGKIFNVGNGLLGYQLAFQHSTTVPILWYRNTVNTAGTWGKWTNISTDDVRYRGNVPSGSNVDTFKGADYEGVWLVNNPATVVGLPPGSGKNGQFTVGIGTGFHTYMEYASIPRFWFRGVRSVTTGEWSPWIDLSARSEAAPAAPSPATHHAEERQARVADALSRSGGVIGTGGKGVVMLRFDDYPDTLLSKVVPLMEAHDLPCYWAATVSHVENLYPTTWATLNATAIQSGVQMTGHSWSHGNATTEAGVRRELVESADYFESKMPATRIDVWTQPSTGTEPPYDVGDGGYDGAGPSLYKSLAGRLLMSRYAVVNGKRSGYYNPQGLGLDGSLLQGHLTYEGLTFVQFKAAVDLTASGGFATDLMLHPGRLDQEGYMTSATFAQCMAYLAQLRAEGSLMVLSGLARIALNPTTEHRHDLLPKAMTNWTRGTLVDGVLKVSASEQVINGCHPDRHAGMRGSVREVYAKVRSAVANTIRLELKSLDGTFTVVKEYAIPGDGQWHEIRKFVLIPYSLGATYVQVGYKSSTAAAFDLTEAHMFAA